MSKKIELGYKILLLMITALLSSVSMSEAKALEGGEASQPAADQAESQKDFDHGTHASTNKADESLSKKKLTPEELKIAQTREENEAFRKRVKELEKRSNIDTFAKPRQEANLEQARKNSREGIKHEKSKEGAKEALDTEHPKEEKTDKKGKARPGQDDESPLKKSTVNEAQRDEDQARLKSRNGLFLSKDEDKAIENKAKQNGLDGIENEPEKLEAARAKTNKMNAELEAKKASTAEKSENVTKKTSKFTNLKNKMKSKLTGKKSVGTGNDAKNLSQKAESDASKVGAADKKQGFFSKLFGSKPKPNVPTGAVEKTATESSRAGGAAGEVLSAIEHF